MIRIAVAVPPRHAADSIRDQQLHVSARQHINADKFHSAVILFQNLQSFDYINAILSRETSCPEGSLFLLRLTR
jgi:hypothetical protein